MAETIETTPAIEAARAQVERLVQSRIFRASEVLRHLLSYLAEKSLAGESDKLKEYTIGLDALGKPSSFDPRQESVVRMHTARLRQKLAEYYRTEGIEDPIVVDLPKGGFKLTFESRHAVPEPTPQLVPAVEAAVGAAPGAVAERGRRWRTREIVLAAALVAALGAAVYTAMRLWSVERTEAAPAAWTPELRELWGPLLSSSRRLVVCVATPLFVQVPGFGVVRDANVNEWTEAPKSQELSSLKGALKAPATEPSYGYTNAGSATGAFLLGQFLAPRKQTVVITRANLLSWPEIAEDNVIFLGPVTGIHPAQDIPMDAQIVLDPTGIRNLKPRPGEPAALRDQPGQGSGTMALTYALISRVPAMNGSGAILMLSGNTTASVMGAVQAFTNPGLAKTLVAKLRTPAGTIPHYFQVVLSVKSMDDVPVEVSYVFHRALSDPSQTPAVIQ
jgi:hypothetical protein